MEGATARRRVDGARRSLARLRAEARAIDVRELTRAVVRGYDEHDVLSYASAISFQVFFALIPLTLFAVGLLGLLELQGVWHAGVAPELQPRLAPGEFMVIDQTVTRILGERQGLWVTFGAALAVWEASGAMWSIMRAFNSIYGVTERRPFWRRVWVSVALAVASAAVLVVAVAVAWLSGPVLTSILGDTPFVAGLAVIVRLALVAALLFLLVGLLVRFAPATSRPAGWVGFGALVVVVAWIAMSLLFGWYITSVADYTSFFGNLATMFVSLEYLYLSSLVLLTGIQIDSLTRRQVEGPGRS